MGTWKTKAYSRTRQSLQKVGWDLHPATNPSHSALMALRWLRDQQRGARGAGQDIAFLNYVAQNYEASHSQIFQDLFVLFVLDGQRDGFFVEFGATDGKLLSNTLLLENDYAWSGILAEPARTWHDQLAVNRTAAIDHRCVSSTSGQRVAFVESVPNPAHSVVSNKSTNQLPGHETITYDVETISLADLLDLHAAPAVIDYLSVDTEGTEWDILSHFDFSSREIRVLTVEHNGEPNRTRIRQLLEARGFERVLSQLSGWDDWYVSHAEAAKLREELS